MRDCSDTGAPFSVEGPTYEGTPRTRQSPLTLAAFRPWGSSQDGRRAGSADESSGECPRGDDAVGQADGAGVGQSGGVLEAGQDERRAKPAMDSATIADGGFA
ncbi:hypothetical protein MMIN_14640 [Mycolicibacter minnesotensis]|nr:hypothetical protein MMIN_14640 [Mycolicibacter minnesotensis]